MFDKLTSGLSGAMMKPILMKIKASMVEQDIKTAFMYMNKSGKLCLRTFKETHYAIPETILNKLPVELQAEIKKYNGYEDGE
jgi:predicted sugar kinase